MDSNGEPMTENQDHETFEKLFLPLRTALRGYLFAVTRDWTEADDLFQEVAIVLWRKFGNYDRTRGFRSWAMGIARLQILKRRQALARSRLIFSEEAVASLAAAAGDEPEGEDVRLVHLSACIGKLSINEKAVVARRYGQKQSLAEMAAHLQKSVEAVGMMLMRIRRELRDCVEKAMIKGRAGVQ